MALELRQHLKLTQQLVMTPQLQQAIKLLQLSRVELIEAIDQEMEINPVLEESESEDAQSSDDSGQSKSTQGEKPDETEGQMPTLASSDLEEIPWEDKAIQEMDWKHLWDEESRVTLPSYSFEQKEAPNYENILTSTTDLTEHLMWQFQMSRFNDTERQIGCLIMGNLDKNGYLKVTAEEIAKDIGCTSEAVENVLKRVHVFDPVGIAARDLRECLLIQLNHQGINDPLIRGLIMEHLGNIERHNYQAIAKDTGCSMEDIVKAIDVITELEPRPGQYYSNEHIQYIVPDLYIYKVDDEYVISLNDEGMPRLRISPFYRDAIKNGIAQHSAKDFIQEKLKSAIWLIRSIHQRQKTVYKVTKSIIKFQRDFLDKGIIHIKPLILKDVADDVDMHESTVSRVTTNKYAHTPQGIIELKFFFSSGLHRKNGCDVATRSIKELIRQMIQEEDLTRPYSDNQIMDLLARDNITIARRTVAKYRDIMGILPSSRRKRPVVN